MASYRIYPLGADDHISAPPHDVECASDDEACAMAAELIGPHPAVEIWVGSRVVGRLTAEGCRAARFGYNDRKEAADQGV